MLFRCQQLIEAVGGEGDWRAVGDAGAVGACSRIGEEGGGDAAGAVVDPIGPCAAPATSTNVALGRKRIA